MVIKGDMVILPLAPGVESIPDCYVIGWNGMHLRRGEHTKLENSFAKAFSFFVAEKQEQQM